MLEISLIIIFSLARNTLFLCTYDAAHNQTSKTDSKGITTYTYDDLERLKTVTEPSGQETTYTFDMAGNRKIETITLDGVISTTTYSYNEQNRMKEMSFINKLF